MKTSKIKAFGFYRISETGEKSPSSVSPKQAINAIAFITEKDCDEALELLHFLEELPEGMSMEDARVVSELTIKQAQEGPVLDVSSDRTTGLLAHQIRLAYLLGLAKMKQVSS